MTTSPAPDVDGVLDRMGRSAFGYRSFLRPEEDLAPPRDMVAALTPEAPVSAVATTPLRFPLIADALPDSAASAPVAPAAPPTEALAATAGPTNPFLPHTQAVPPPRAVSSTSLAGMFRVLSGRADSARQRDDVSTRAPIFPFRHG